MLREHHYVTDLSLGTLLFLAFDLHTAVWGRLTRDEENKALRAGDLTEFTQLDSSSANLKT